MEERLLKEEEKDLIINWFKEKEGSNSDLVINTYHLRNKLDKSPKTCLNLIEDNIKKNSYKIDSLSFYMLINAHV